MLAQHTDTKTPATEPIWSGVIYETSLAIYEPVIRKLNEGNKHSLKLRILRPGNPTLYYIKTNDKGRLIFTFITIKTENGTELFIWVLEAVPNHKFNSARYLRDASVVQRELKKKYDSIVQLVKQTRDEKGALTSKKIAKPDKCNLIPVNYTGDKWVRLSNGQGEVFDSPLPLFFVGAAGTGKTLLLNIYMQLHALKEEHEPEMKFLYLADLQRVVDKMREALEKSFIGKKENCHRIVCMTYKELLQQRISDYKEENEETQVHTKEWISAQRTAMIKRYKTTQSEDSAAAMGKLLEDRDLVYKEFRIMSGHTKEKYTDLGDKQSNYSKDSREFLYSFYESYQTYLKNNKKIHPAFFSFSDINDAREKFDGIFADEGQDYSTRQIKEIFGLLKGNNKKIIVCAGPNQNVEDNIPNKSFILDQIECISGNRNFINLTASFRCPAAVEEIARRWLDIKWIGTRGPNDSDEGNVARIKNKENADKDANESVVFISAADKNYAQYINELREMLNNSPDCIVVALEHELEKARILFKTQSRVFSPKDIKGLEYETIIFKDAFSSPAFRPVNEKLSDGQVLKKENKPRSKRNRRKPGERVTTDAYYNEVYTGITRATKRLIFVEENEGAKENANKQHRTQHILHSLQKEGGYTEKLTLMPKSVVTIEAWRNEFEKQVKENNIKQAVGILKEHLPDEAQKIINDKIVTSLIESKLQQAKLFFIEGLDKNLNLAKNQAEFDQLVNKFMPKRVDVELNISPDAEISTPAGRRKRRKRKNKKASPAETMQNKYKSDNSKTLLPLKENFTFYEFLMALSKEGDLAPELQKSLGCMSIFHLMANDSAALYSALKSIKVKELFFNFLLSNGRINEIRHNESLFDYLFKNPKANFLKLFSEKDIKKLSIEITKETVCYKFAEGDYWLSRLILNDESFLLRLMKRPEFTKKITAEILCARYKDKEKATSSLLLTSGVKIEILKYLIEHNPDEIKKIKMSELLAIYQKQKYPFMCHWLGSVIDEENAFDLNERLFQLIASNCTENDLTTELPNKKYDPRSPDPEFKAPRCNFVDTLIFLPQNLGIEAIVILLKNNPALAKNKVFSMESLNSAHEQNRRLGTRLQTMMDNDVYTFDSPVYNMLLLLVQHNSEFAKSIPPHIFFTLPPFKKNMLGPMTLFSKIINFKYPNLVLIQMIEQTPGFCSILAEYLFGPLQKNSNDPKQFPEQEDFHELVERDTAHQEIMLRLLRRDYNTAKYLHAETLTRCIKTPHAYQSPLQVLLSSEAGKDILMILVSNNITLFRNLPKDAFQNETDFFNKLRLIHNINMDAQQSSRLIRIGEILTEDDSQLLQCLLKNLFDDKEDFYRMDLYVEPTYESFIFSLLSLTKHREILYRLMANNLEIKKYFFDFLLAQGRINEVRNNIPLIQYVLADQNNNFLKLLSDTERQKLETERTAETLSYYRAKENELALRTSADSSQSATQHSRLFSVAKSPKAAQEMPEKTVIFMP